MGTETTDEGETKADAGKFVLPPVFGMAVKQKVRKGLKRGVNAKSYLDETGADMDEINNAEKTYQGDYDVYKPNDDMAYGDEGMEAEQAAEVGAMEQQMEKVEALHEQDEAEDGDSSDDEDDAGKALEVEVLAARQGKMSLRRRRASSRAEVRSVAFWMTRCY